MNRTYRVTVRGRFIELDSAQRGRLLARQSAHGMLASRYTPEGTFLYGPELVGYQFRYLFSVQDESPDDADFIARIEAEERAANHIRERGLQGRITTVDLACVEDMKFRTPRS